MRNPNKAAVSYLTAVLPSGAYDTYFKDIIGNISTSNFRNEFRKSVLELQPRYPLYGGWRFTWFHGYKVGTEGFLKRNLANGLYLLSFPFSSSISELTIDHQSLKFILPEGATYLG
jgi:oligosaccharyltransferase complex subunit alpha (ribophorin I)